MKNLTAYMGVLENHIFPTLRTVCPESGPALLDEIQQLGVTFEFERTTQRFLFDADPDRKRIRVGIFALARIWALAYGHFVHYEAMQNAKKANSQNRHVDVTATPDLQAANELLEWAYNSELEVRAVGHHAAVSDWPLHLSHPLPHAAKGSNEQVADELMLASVGFILHHEWAHLRLKHSAFEKMKTVSDSATSVTQEKEADLASAQWLLGGLSNEFDAKFMKRSFGITLALAYFASLSVYSDYRGSSHPPGYDRLYQVLSQVIYDPMHPTWAFAQITLADQKQRFLQQGEVVRASPCGSPYRAVLHAVAVDGFYQSSPQIVGSAVAKSLAMAADMSAKRVALTALATGYGRLSMRQFAEGVKPVTDLEYPPIQEVVICVRNEFDLSDLTEALSMRWSDPE